MRRLRQIPLRPVIAAIAVVLLLAGGLRWFRDSSFVAVKDVYILGVSSSQERAIRSALRTAAQDMTTLHVREDQLRLAVKPFASVADLRVSTDFPHEMTIEVVEREPIAAVELGGVRIPVGAGGLVMRGVRAGRELPTLKAKRLGPDSRLLDERALAAVSVLAAAPGELRSRIARAWYGPRGLMLDMRSGPDLVFGSGRHLAAKWAAASRVLAEPSAKGAVYLDVRVPERVAAGGLGPVATPTPAPTTTSTVAPVNPQPQPEITPSLTP